MKNDIFGTEIGSGFEEPGDPPPPNPGDSLSNSVIDPNNRTEKLGAVKSLQKVTLTAIKHSSKVRKCLIIYHFTK